jgi:predicted CoA-binding protein
MFDTPNTNETSATPQAMTGAMGTFQNPSDEEIANLLRNARNIAVVGLSEDVTKASYMVAKYIQSQGYEVVPINPHADMVMGRKAHKTLLDVEGPIDIVNVFRRSHHVAEIVDHAIQIKAKTVWTQFDIVDEAAARRAQEAGIIMIMDRCLKIDHYRLLGKEKL